MKVYISGPIAGELARNEDAFKSAQAELNALGHETVNPCALTPLKTWEENLRRDIKLLMDCQGIYMLKGWHRSRGATLERMIAMRLRFEFLGEIGNPL